jgi:hypothetical protein
MMLSGTLFPPIPLRNVTRDFGDQCKPRTRCGSRPRRWSDWNQFDRSTALAITRGVAAINKATIVAAVAEGEVTPRTRDGTIRNVRNEQRGALRGRPQPVTRKGGPKGRPKGRPAATERSEAQCACAAAFFLYFSKPPFPTTSAILPSGARNLSASASGLERIVPPCCLTISAQASRSATSRPQ